MISPMMKRVAAGVAACLTVVVVPTCGLSAANADEAHPVVTGTGWTDVSTLDVQGWEGADPAEAPPPVHPSSSPRPRTDKIACGGRIDFYRVIKFGGGTTCFQNSGTLKLSSVIVPVEYVCPGNNVGAVNYYPGLGLGGYRWSLDRDGHSNFNACWRFDRPTTTDVANVRINR